MKGLRGRVWDPRKQELAEGARSVAWADWRGAVPVEEFRDLSQAEFPKVAL